MLFLKGHGGHAIYDDPSTGYSMSHASEARSVCGFGVAQSYPDWTDANLGKFGYLCLSDEDAPHGAAVLHALTHDASDMIVSYSPMFGQFPA
ncbi:hypothetical protein [Dinoroseobacter sp. S375]|uniref:hypothetical protein n=1 Tax=Dinoroseobacter sp. S375 TaxID=3415136 RepID=UPI003C7E81FC